MSLALRPRMVESQRGEAQGLPAYVPTLGFRGADTVCSLAKAFAIHAWGLCSFTLW